MARYTKPQSQAQDDDLPEYRSDIFLKLENAKNVMQNLKESDNLAEYDRKAICSAIVEYMKYSLLHNLQVNYSQDVTLWYVRLFTELTEINSSYSVFGLNEKEVLKIQHEIFYELGIDIKSPIPFDKDDEKHFWDTLEVR